MTKTQCMVLTAILAVIVSCSSTKRVWVNKNLESRGLDSTQIESTFTVDNTVCIDIANQKYGVSPPANAARADLKCDDTSAAVLTSVLCGYEAAAGDKRWVNARNNAHNICMTQKGWKLINTKNVTKTLELNNANNSNSESGDGCLGLLDGSVVC